MLLKIYSIVYTNIVQKSEGVVPSDSPLYERSYICDFIAYRLHFLERE
jgi:hypothetical protein